MPKVIINDSQGLKQTSGSGIEISSDLDMSSELRGAKKDILATTVTLTLADSGAALVPLGPAKTYTLPAVADAAGFNVTFFAGSANAHKIQALSAVLQGAIFFGADGANTVGRVTVTNTTSITLDAGTIGDYMTIISDGTNYYVHGWTSNDVSLT